MNQRDLFASLARGERRKRKLRVLRSQSFAIANLFFIFIAIFASVELDNRSIRLDTKQGIGGTSIYTPRIVSLAGPRKMRLSDSSSIQLVFAPPETLKILQHDTSKFESEREFIVMTPIPAASLEHAFGPGRTTVAEARIEAANLDIRPLQPAIQGLHQEALVWDWNIRPLEVGAQTVNVRLELHWIPSAGNEEITERFLVGRFEFEVRVVETYPIPTAYLAPIAMVSLTWGLIGTVLAFSKKNIYFTANRKIPDHSIPNSGIFAGINKQLPKTSSPNPAQKWEVLFPTLLQKPPTLTPGALPPELIKRLNDILVCSTFFESNIALHTLFTDARIAPWRAHLPEASTRADRVAALIYKLHDKTNIAGENALFLFLHVLAANTNSADALCPQLFALAADLERALHK